MNRNTPGPNDQFKPIHPVGLIPRDWDFGNVFQSSQDTPGKDSRTFLRFYDEAVKSWLTYSTVMNGRRIPVISALPRHAFAEYKSLLGRIPETSANAQHLELKRMPLPMASLTRSGVQIRSWGSTPYPQRGMGFVNATKDLSGTGMRRATVYSRAPTPVNIPYAIEIWTEYEAEHAWMAQAVLEQFWHKTAYWACRGPYAPKDDRSFVVPIHLRELKDNSDNSIENDFKASKRWTLDVEVEGWMFHDLLLAPTALSTTTDVIADDEVIASVNQPHTSTAPPPLSEQDPGGEAPVETVPD